MGSVETSLLIFVPKTSLRSLLKLTLNQVEFGVACCKIYLTLKLCVFQFLSHKYQVLWRRRGDPQDFRGFLYKWSLTASPSLWAWWVDALLSQHQNNHQFHYFKAPWSYESDSSGFIYIVVISVYQCAYILKGGSRGSRNPQTILNFPQKDCLTSWKESRLHCLQSFWLSFPLIMFSHCLTSQWKH